MKRFFRFVLPALLAGSQYPAVYAANAAIPPNAIAMYQGSDRQTRLVEGAKKEGEVSVYYAHPILPAIMTAFTQKYGIRVKSWRAGSEALQQRLMAELRAGRADADVVLNTVLDTEGDYREKLLQEVWSPYQQDLIAQALPAHRQWAAFNLDVYAAAYNTAKIKKEDLPKTYQDLVDSKWKGRLGIEAADHIWFGSLIGELGEERGRKLFENIIATNGMSVRKGHSLLTTMVASGEVPLALTVYSWNPEQVKRKGAPIEGHLIPPLFALPTAVAVLARAPHPYAAVLFYDFVLNEGQKLMAEASYVPTSKKVASPLGSTPFKWVEAAHALDMQSKWMKAYEETVTRKAR